MATKKTKTRSQMDWNKLLSRVRLGKDQADEHDRARSSFDRDADRVIYSSAFRRLQDKTQVFPLARNDYVRTRLTHSLEVSSVGRTLGSKVGELVLNESKIDGVEPADFASLTAAACLAHDIGNPPFGHSGESAIQTFFERDPVGIALCREAPSSRPDLQTFEGNAQAFRILTSLEYGRQSGGLQLTKATLAAGSKYPCSVSASKKPTNTKSVMTKKHGFHKTEAEIFADVAASTGLILVSKDQWARHPIAFLVEAADDICYRIIDIEDGVRQRLVSSDEAHQALLALANGEKRDAIQSRAKSLSDASRTEYLRAIAIGGAIGAVVTAFLENQTRILEGTFHESLIDASELRGPLNTLKTMAKEKIYSSRAVLEIEAAGYEVLGGLLRTYGEVFLRHIQKKTTHRERILLDLLPRAYREIIEQQKRAPDWVMLLTDWVSGMTDTFAVSHYRQIRGIT